MFGKRRMYSDPMPEAEANIRKSGELSGRPTDEAEQSMGAREQAQSDHEKHSSRPLKPDNRRRVGKA